MQNSALAPAGAEERRSVVRKLYLYSFLFVATLTVLASAVYLVFRLLSLLLAPETGGRGNLLADLAQAIAFLIIGLGVWLYHGAAVRGDGSASRRDRLARLANLRVAVLDADHGELGRVVVAGLRQAWPELCLEPVGLTPEAAEAMGASAALLAEPQALAGLLAGAGLIISPWHLALPGAAGGLPLPVGEALAASPAAKVAVPTRPPGWEWAGVDRWSPEALARQTVRAVEQVLAGEAVRAVRPLSPGAVVGVALAVLLLLSLIVPLIIFLATGQAL